MSTSADTIPFPRLVGPFVVLFTKTGGMRVRVDAITSWNESPCDPNNPQSKLGTRIRYQTSGEFWTAHSMSQIDEIIESYYAPMAKELDYVDAPY